MLKTAITDNYLITEDIIDKLNVFYFYNQISKEQYAELMNMVAPPIAPTDTSNSTSPSDSTTTN
jgi:hypothetical protein